MKFIYLIIFCLFYSFNSHALEYSCIDKKYGRFSKMFIKDQLLKYEDEKGEPAEYKVLENSDKRGWKNHHLDHIYPISLGFHNKIPPKKIGNIKNLQFIPYKENLRKGSTITNESRNALRRLKRLKG